VSNEKGYVIRIHKKTTVFSLSKTRRITNLAQLSQDRTVREGLKGTVEGKSKGDSYSRDIPRQERETRE